MSFRPSPKGERRNPFSSFPVISTGAERSVPLFGYYGFLDCATCGCSARNDRGGRTPRHPLRPVGVPGALLGANACVAHRPRPLAQVAVSAPGFSVGIPAIGRYCYFGFAARSTTLPSLPLEMTTGTGIKYPSPGYSFGQQPIAFGSVALGIIAVAPVCVHPVGQHDPYSIALRVIVYIEIHVEIGFLVGKRFLPKILAL